MIRKIKKIKKKLTFLSIFSDFIWGVLILYVYLQCKTKEIINV